MGTEPSLRRGTTTRLFRFAPSVASGSGGLRMPDRTLAEASSAKEDYTGHELDRETGLHYAGARYYMSALGRWTSPDPLADAEHLLPYSPYHYSYNNPLLFVDPDGRNPILRGLKVVKRAYKAYQRGDNLASLKTWKKMGADEWAGFVDNVSTLADGAFSVDDAFAAIDLVTGFGGEAKRGAKALGVVDEAGDAVKIKKPYKRPSGATTRAQRESVQGKPCVDCGQTASTMHADHKNPLVKEYYETGTIDKQRMRDVDAVQPQCPTCSNRQGAELSRYSKKKEERIWYRITKYKKNKRVCAINTGLRLWNRHLI